MGGAANCSPLAWTSRAPLGSQGAAGEFLIRTVLTPSRSQAFGICSQLIPVSTQAARAQKWRVKRTLWQQSASGRRFPRGASQNEGPLIRATLFQKAFGTLFALRRRRRILKSSSSTWIGNSTPQKSSWVYGHEHFFLVSCSNIFGSLMTFGQHTSASWLPCQPSGLRFFAHRPVSFPRQSGAIFQQDTAVDLSRRALRMGPVITQCQARATGRLGDWGAWTLMDCHAHLMPSGNSKTVGPFDWWNCSG